MFDVNNHYKTKQDSVDSVSNVRNVFPGYLSTDRKLATGHGIAIGAIQVLRNASVTGRG